MNLGLITTGILAGLGAGRWGTNRGFTSASPLPFIGVTPTPFIQAEEAVCVNPIDYFIYDKYNPKNLCDAINIFELSGETLTEENIKNKYRQLLLNYHPDKVSKCTVDHEKATKKSQ